MIIIVILISLPDLLSKPFFTLTDKTNIILTSVLAMFAVIQGYSAYNQVSMEKKRNEIEALSNELEKAYGPIHAILSKPVRQDENAINLQVSEKLIIDEKLSTYHCMFSANITDYWEKNIRKSEPNLSTDPLTGSKDLLNSSYSIASGVIDAYRIPLEFVEMFNAEYAKRIAAQRELLTNR